MIFYTCDLQDHCSGAAFCSKNGGDCHHTTNAKHAINGECKNPEKEPDRFVSETYDTKGINGNDTAVYYWEKDGFNEFR